jgi:hypothetical protein
LKPAGSFAGEFRFREDLNRRGGKCGELRMVFFISAAQLGIGDQQASSQK